MDTGPWIVGPGWPLAQAQLPEASDAFQEGSFPTNITLELFKIPAIAEDPSSQKNKLHISFVILQVGVGNREEWVRM